MKSLYGLTDEQMQEVYEHYRKEEAKQIIYDYIYNESYFVNDDYVDGDVIVGKINLDYLAEYYLENTQTEFDWVDMELKIDELVGEWVRNNNKKMENPYSVKEDNDERRM